MIEKERRNTEELIKKAAANVFIRKGYSGSTMQEIATEAGINKALLHYYFRTKNRLFETIFNEATIQFLPQVGEIIESDRPFFEKIEAFVDVYLDMLMENRYVPQFIIHELNMNPDHVVSLIKRSGINFTKILMMIEEEIKKGTIRPVGSLQLLVNIFSMCIFPFIAWPIFQNINTQNGNDDFESFIEERKKELPSFIINSIMKR
jgi:AcrR family transcriptional regulator